MDNIMQENWNTVADILGLGKKEFFGGVENCEVSVQNLSTILDMGFIKPEQKMNNSPTVNTFLEFGIKAMAEGSTVKYIGFLESISRKDARLLVDGIIVTNFPKSVDLIMSFAQTFHGADEFTSNHEILRAWYD